MHPPDLVARAREMLLRGAPRRDVIALGIPASTVDTWRRKMGIPPAERRRRDLTGQRFGRLVALAPCPPPSGDWQRVWWLCRCDCGAEWRVRSSDLRGGKTRSCGCLRAEVCAMVGRTWRAARRDGQRGRRIER